MTIGGTDRRARRGHASARRIGATGLVMALVLCSGLPVSPPAAAAAGSRAIVAPRLASPANPGGGAGSSGGSGTSQGGGTIGAWVATARDGGVRAPSGRTCDPWRRSPGANTAPITYVNGRRVTWFMHDRTCGDVTQFVWVPDLQGRDLAALAYDAVTSRAPDPQVMMSPPADTLLVNLPVWFGARPLATRSATAAVPGRSATVRLVPVSLELETGSHAGDDPSVVACALWGSAERSEDGCTWTPRYPSVPQTTGTDDYRFHGRLSMNWDATWVASNGTSGAFAPIITTTDLALAVREIQTV